LGKGAKYIFENGGETLRDVKALCEKYPDGIPSTELDAASERVGCEVGLVSAIEDILRNK